MSWNSGSLNLPWIPKCLSKPVYKYLYIYLCIVHIQSNGPGSSVGIATELRAGLSGIESKRGQDFPPVQTGPGAHPASYMGAGSFPGVEAPGAWDWPPPHLVCRGLRKSIVIPLLILRALVAYKREKTYVQYIYIYIYIYIFLFYTHTHTLFSERNSNPDLLLLKNVYVLHNPKYHYFHMRQDEAVVVFTPTIT